MILIIASTPPIDSSSGGVDAIMKKEWAAAVERGLANSSLQEVKNAV